MCMPALKCEYVSLQVYEENERFGGTSCLMHTGTFVQNVEAMYKGVFNF